MAHSRYIREDFKSCLGHLIEECGEVLAAAGKTVRFGLNSVNPELPPAQQETNADWLIRELDDLEDTIARLRVSMGRPHRGATGRAIADAAPAPVASPPLHDGGVGGDG